MICGNAHAEKKVPAIQRMLDEVYNLIEGSDPCLSGLNIQNLQVD